MGQLRHYDDVSDSWVVLVGRQLELTGEVLLTGTSSDARNDATLTSALIKYLRFNQIERRKFAVSLLRS